VSGKTGNIKRNSQMLHILNTQKYTSNTHNSDVLESNHKHLFIHLISIFRPRFTGDKGEGRSNFNIAYHSFILRSNK
jgi:hypothetical protein